MADRIGAGDPLERSPIYIRRADRDIPYPTHGVRSRAQRLPRVDHAGGPPDHPDVVTADVTQC
jgi:hypothetical protein